MDINDYIDISVLQRIQNDFSLATGLAALTVDLNGKQLTVPSNFTEFCQLIRKSELGAKHCAECDSFCDGAYRCHSGLWDLSTSIVISGKLLAKVKAGQVLTTPLDMAHVATLASELSIDEEELIAAAKKLPYRSEASLYAAASLLKVNIENFLAASYIKKISEQKMYAEEANKAKSTFLANMSHEMRTPLNAVIGFSDLILMENLDQKLLNYVAIIKNSSQSLMAIINDVLDFSKIEADKMEIVPGPYQLQDTVREIISLNTLSAEKKGLTFETELDDSLPSLLFGDELRIRQILTNLISNAVKFTWEGGITMRVFGRLHSADTVLLQFSVKDTGIGIKSEDMEKLFNEFSRLDGARTHSIEGTGLGLAISMRLAQLMGGTIDVESTYGKGSIFTVSLLQKILDHTPISQSSGGGLQQPIFKRPTVYAPKAKVLNVDDNIVNLRLGKEMLKKFGITCDVARSGRESIEMIRKKDYDLIFMDHMMPEMDGIETLQHIRSMDDGKYAELKIIAISANVTSGIRDMYISRGFDDYLPKPTDFYTLDRLLHRQLPELCEELPAEAPASTPSAQTKGQKNSNVSSQNIVLINTSAGIENCSGDSALYLEILREFSADHIARMTNLQKAYAAKDWKTYALEAHSIKGLSLSIGANSFSETARKHEMAAKSGDTAFIFENYEEFRKAFLSLNEEVQSLVTEMSETVML